MYPEIARAHPGDAAPRLKELASSYLYQENFVIAERIKRLGNEGRSAARSHFWRTTQQQEIDYVEEQAGQLRAWEIKWNPAQSARFPSTFIKAYPESETAVVHRETLDAFLLEA